MTVHNLATAKVGDRVVIVNERYGGTEVATITSVTKARVRIGESYSQRAFLRSDGTGVRCYWQRIEEVLT